MPYRKTDDRLVLEHPKVCRGRLCCTGDVSLKCSYGALAEILLFGATVISWRATEKGRTSDPTERLFVSSKAALDGSKAVRGGIPVVFPCFGPPEHPDHSKLPQHGFARNQVWVFDSVVTDNDA